MATSARLDVSDLEVVPGVPAQCRLSVTNHSTVVEAYALRVVGALEGWAVVEPSSLSLYPEAEGEATVTITAPRGPGVPAGDVPFAVVVEPQEHPGDVAVPEAVAHVDAFDDVTAEMTPRNSHGRRVARHSLALDNRGNRPVSLAVAGWDPDGALDFRARPEEVLVRPGEAVFVNVAVMAVDRIWRGTPVSRQFRLTAEHPAALEAAPTGPAAAPVAQVDGMMVQDPTLPSWLGRALLGVAAGLAALAVLWFAVLKPTVETTAQNAAEDAVAEQIEELQDEVVAARQEAAQAQADAGSAQQQAEAATASTTEAQEQQAQTQEALVAQQQAQTGVPFNQRLAVSAPAGGSDTTTFEVPDGQLLRVTDLVFESPGDVGRLQVRRDDQVLLSLQPENFRDLDQHFVSPIIFTEGQELVVEVTCTTPAAGAASCEEAVYVGGSLAPVPEPSPTATPDAG